MLLWPIVFCVIGAGWSGTLAAGGPGTDALDDATRAADDALRLVLGEPVETQTDGDEAAAAVEAVLRGGPRLDELPQHRRSEALAKAAMTYHLIGDRWPREVRQRIAVLLSRLEIKPRRIVADEDAGRFAFRSGEGDEPFITLVDLDQSSPEAASSVGHIALRGGGRWWLASPEATVTGEPDPRPRRADRNVIAVLASPVTREAAAVPTRGGSLHRLRGNRDGSGSVSLLYGGYRELRPEGEPSEELDVKGWRAVGIDYSGASGARALLVIVDALTGTGGRQRVWQMHIGDVAADRVELGDRSFTVRPEGSDLVMTGTIMLPAEVTLSYDPPRSVERGGTRGGVVRAMLTQPMEGTEDLLERSIRSGGGIDSAPSLPDEFSELMGDGGGGGLESGEERAARLASQRRRREDAAALRSKVRLHSPSVKMGAGDRGPRASTAVVAVIAVHRGDPPRIRVPGEDDPLGLLRIGGDSGGKAGQRVMFTPNLVTFETTREVADE